VSVCQFRDLRLYLFYFMAHVAVACSVEVMVVVLYEVGHFDGFLFKFGEWGY
jgi:hypothetical protein